MNRYVIYNKKTKKFLTTSRHYLWDDYWGDFDESALFNQAKNALKVLKDAKLRADEVLDNKYFGKDAKRFLEKDLPSLVIVEVDLIPKLP